MRSILKEERETAQVIKYLSKMLRRALNWGNNLVPINDEIALKTHELNIKYAKIIGDDYCRAFFQMKEEFDSTGVYYPDIDFNFLLWSLIPHAIQSALYFKENEKIPYDEIMVPRKDGGNYAAWAKITRIDKLPFDEKYYRYCGDMGRGSNKYNVFGWQFNTYWSDRLGWRQFTNREVELCYEFRNGLLPQEERNIDDYKYLIDKGYLIKENDQYKLNVVWCDNGEVHNNLLKVFPQASEELRSLLKDLDRESYELMRKNKPDHVDKICRVWTQNSATASLLRAHILKYLVDCNLLKEPKGHQRKAVTTIMGVRS
jgi:hypothetical protein